MKTFSDWLKMHPCTTQELWKIQNMFLTCTPFWDSNIKDVYHEAVEAWNLSRETPKAEECPCESRHCALKKCLCDCHKPEEKPTAAVRVDWSGTCPPIQVYSKKEIDERMKGLWNAVQLQAKEFVEEYQKEREWRKALLDSLDHPHLHKEDKKALADLRKRFL